MADAEREFAAALVVHKQLAADFPAVPDYRDGLALSHNNLGYFPKMCGRLREAQVERRHAVAADKPKAVQGQRTPTPHATYDAEQCREAYCDSPIRTV